MASTTTLAEFREELQVLIGLSESSPVFTEDRIDSWFHQTYRHITMPHVFRHPELETTEYVAMTTADKYALVNEYRRIYTVAIVDEAYTVTPPATPAATARRYRLTQRTTKSWDDKLKVTARPREYAHWARQLEIDCVPDSTWSLRSLQIRGYKMPAALTADTHTMVISSDWDEVVQAGMRYRFWLAKGEDDKIEFSREDYTRLINERAEFLQQSSDDFHVGAIDMDTSAIDFRGSS